MSGANDENQASPGARVSAPVSGASDPFSTPERLALRDTVRRFVATEISP
ncbi:MAG: hypothetical protein JWQ77_1809, partial [Jatrophihabitans sp.]|nr:hypothetical protein [Jatrophihabitans sp.]